MKKAMMAICVVALLSSVVHAADVLVWKELPELPPAPGQAIQPGLAGAFAGVCKDPDGVNDDALIVAGGANFPDYQVKAQ